MRMGLWYANRQLIDLQVSYALSAYLGLREPSYLMQGWAEGTFNQALTTA
jgi:hypothetical protein